MPDIDLETLGRCPCGDTAVKRDISARDEVTGEPFAYLVCASCGLERLSPRPRPQDMARYYPDDYAPYHDSRSSSRVEKIRLLIYLTFWAPTTERPPWLRRSLWLLRTLLYPLRWHSLVFFTPPEDRFVFEFGAANGSNLVGFRSMGWQVAGCEPSTYACKSATKQEIALQNCTAEAANIPADVTCIYMNNVFEHLHDPGAVLRRCYDALRTSGLVVLVVPNHDSWAARLFRAAWPGYDPPRHLWGYTPHSLTVLLHRAGFRTIAIGQRFPLSDHCWHAAVNGYRLPMRPRWRITISRFARRLHILILFASFAALFGHADYLCVVARKSY